MRANRFVLPTVLALGLGVIVAGNALVHPTSGVATSSSTVSSSVIYCAGLTNATGGTPGVVTFFNRASSPRTLHIIEAATGAAEPVSFNVTLASQERHSFSPASVLKGGVYAVQAQVNGDGVIGVESALGDHAEAACVNHGVRSWVAAGFDTVVHDRATLVLYNPTATAAVVNLSTYSGVGFDAPAPFQGITVGAGQVSTINLGGQIVNARNVGVVLNVLRGTLVVVGDQFEGSVTSLDTGALAPAARGQFVLVPTNEGAVAQIRLANPTDEPVTVNCNVHLGQYQIPVQSLTVPAYGNAEQIITPNTAIPAGGEASVSMQAAAPVIATLASGSADGVLLSPLPAPSVTSTLIDAQGTGFAQAVVVNHSQRAQNVQVTAQWLGSTEHLSESVTLPARSIQALDGLVSGLVTTTDIMVSVNDPAGEVTLSATLPTKPAGQVLAAVLESR